MEITNNRSSAGERISMFVEGVSKLFAFAVGVCVLLAAITFGMVYSFNSDARAALQVTGIGCGAGILLIVALTGAAAFNAYVVRSTAAGAQAGTQKAIETLADSVNRSNDQQQATMAALIAITGNLTGGRAPVQKQLPELQKITERQFKAMPETVAEPIISVPMQDGTVRELPFKRIETIFKMVPEPTQDRWLAHGGGAVDQYGPTCETLCDSEPPLLIRRPAPRRGYVAVGDSTYISQWWENIVNA